MVAGNVSNMPSLLTGVRFLTTAITSGMSYAAVGSLYQQALFSIGLVLFLFIMSEGFLVLDTRTRVLSNNSAALRLLETSCVPVPGETSAFVLSREEGFRRCVEEALAGRRSERMVHRENLCRQIIASPVMQDGHLGGAVLVILDVTEREQRESLRREFTANVSHVLFQMEQQLIVFPNGPVLRCG